MTTNLTNWSSRPACDRARPNEHNSKEEMKSAPFLWEKRLLCVCVSSEHTLSMCQALGAKSWIKGSGQQQSVWVLSLFPSRQRSAFSSRWGPSDWGSLPKAMGCWEIQAEGSCFPSLMYGHGWKRGDWTVGMLEETEWGRGVRPRRKNEVPAGVSWKVAGRERSTWTGT